METQLEQRFVKARALSLAEEAYFDTRRKRGVQFLAAAGLLGVVGLSVLSYWATDSLWPLVSVVFAVAMSAFIDWWGRPDVYALGNSAPPRWYRPHLAMWCLVPFVIALGASVWAHYDKYLEADRDTREIARVLEKHAETREAVEANAKALITGRFGTAVDTDEAKQLIPIVNAVEHDVEKCVERTRRFAETWHITARPRCEADGDTWKSFALAMAIQGLFVMWIPMLLAVSIARAHRRACHRRVREQSVFIRDRKIMAEHDYLFLPRMCFAALLVLGTNYVFSPFGLKATYLIAYANEHGPPGHPTWALWSTSFSNAPVMVAGFVGFLLYALITATQRFVQNDFDDQAMLSLLVRGLVVILLSMALSSTETGPTGRALVFLAGVFPVRVLQMLATRASVSMDPEITGDPTPSFAGLPSLDAMKVFALRSAGIQSTYDLATTDIEEIAERVRIDAALLGRVVDRALLIDALGLTLVARLDLLGISSATQLVAAAKDEPALAASIATIPSSPDPAQAIPPAVLTDAAKRVAAALKDNVRFVNVAKWIDDWNKEAKPQLPT